MKEISISGCKFAYEVIGGSPAVLLETGVGANSSDWGPSRCQYREIKAEVVSPL